MINTLSISRELTKSGLKREYAEAIADVVAKAVVQQNGNLATKEFVHTHVSEMQKGTDGKIDTLRMEIGELRVEVSELRNHIDSQTASVRVEISELRSDMETQIASVHVEFSELRNHIDTQIASVRVEMSALDAKISAVDANISASEARIVRWLVGIAIVLGIFEVFGDVLPSLLSGLG